MANVKITDLPAATAATGADVVPIVQSGTTKKLSFTSLLTSPTLFGSGVSTFLATPSSANLRAAVTDETGTGSLVFAISPTLVTPTLGAATATSINKVALTAPATSATLTIADGKTLTASNSLTLAGTDATTMTFPTTSATVARTDAGQTFTGAQIISTNASGALTPAGIGGTTVLHLHGTDASAARQMISGYGAGTGLDFRRANGTAASPTAVTTNNVIGGITASGYGTSAYASAFRSAVILYAGETWTNTAQGTFLTFTITPLGGTATTEVARIESNGRLQVGNAVSLNGPALTTTAPADFCSVNASTYVDNTTAASGTAAHGTANSFGAKAIAAANAGVTYTNASTIYVHGAPTAGSNVTITNPWAMYVAGGKSYFGADVSVGTGNLSFSGTAQRITGDMSNATIANRLAFQTSTVNGATSVTLIPNGTSANSSINLFNAADPTNAALAGIVVGVSDAQFRSGITGTGTYLPMTFYTGGSERMRIDTSGNVGIGAANPTFRLVSANSVTDGGWMYSSGAVSVLGLGGYASAGDGAFQIRFDRATGSTTLNGGSRDTPAARVTIDNTGNVGIGTASFSNRLTAQVAVDGLSVISYFRNLSNVSANTAAAIDLVADQASSRLTTLRDAGGTSATLVFSNTSAGVMGERMRIDSSGNVGIGTASPQVRLHVSTTDQSTSRLRLQNTGTGGTTFDLVSGSPGVSNAGLGFYDVTSSATRMYINSSGNVGIGTASPSGSLQVSAGNTRVRFSNTTGTASTLLFGADSGQVFLGAETNAPIYFITNNTERMRIDSSGNVNIATAGARITGDFSNATVANRVAFQSSTANGDTGILFIPNGTSTTSTLALLNTSNTTNFSFARLQCTSTAFTIAATRGGSGSYLPIEFQTSGIKRGSIDIDGNVIVGQAAIDVSATAGFLWIPSCAGAPTGAPTAPYTNAAALVADTTNNRLYVRVGSTWRYATLT